MLNASSTDYLSGLSLATPAQPETDIVTQRDPKGPKGKTDYCDESDDVEVGSLDAFEIVADVANRVHFLPGPFGL